MELNLVLVEKTYSVLDGYTLACRNSIFSSHLPPSYDPIFSKNLNNPIALA